MAGTRRSLQDLLRRRQESSFVGRQGQVIQYHENLQLPLDDEGRRFLFNIHGDAGVGKTYLTKQLKKTASDSGALTAYTDESIDDAISAMRSVADQFARNGARLSDFEKRAAAYQQRRHELESDPQAPEGMAEFLTKTTVIIGLAAARDVPFAGSLLAPVNADAAADQVNRARIYLARKVKDRADLRLLISPTDELTPVFVSGLNSAVADSPVALFFDTYERTAPVLDHWLRTLYDGRYGDLPGNLITTISGQLPLNPNVWGDYLPVIADIPLKPFSEIEARQFLASKNITDEPTIDVILTLSGRLPMWLATLAEGRPGDAANIGDPAGSAVERFLKWEDDVGRRSIAITAALPRTVNQDTVSVIAASDNARELFSWLCGLPFVTKSAESWKYHEVVRAAMLRVQRIQSPHEWRANHTALAQAYAGWATEADGSSTDESWSNPDWIDHIREQTYHLLCANPIKNLPQALISAVEAAGITAVRARQWAELIADAGRDTNNSALRQWGQRMRDSIRENDLNDYLTCLIDDAPLDTDALAAALRQRASAHIRSGRNAEALADSNRAVELNPSDVIAITLRGGAYATMGRYEEAVADSSRALELDPGSVGALTMRGLAYLGMERYGEAVADLSRVVELDPGFVWALTMRGFAYLGMERYGEAVADLSHVLELNPDDASALEKRGDAYRSLGRYEEAVADLSHVLELNPDDASALEKRGHMHSLMRHYSATVADLTHAIEARLTSRDPKAAAQTQIQLSFLLMGAGETERAQQLLEDAAASGDPEAVPVAQALLSAVLMDAGETERAQQLLEDALAADTPEKIAPIAQAQLGAALMAAGETERARELLEDAVASGDLEAVSLAQASLGILLMGAGETERARQLLEDAVASGVPDVAPMAQAQLGILLMGAGETERAQQLLEDALASGVPQTVAPMAQVQLAILLIDAGETERALQLLEDAVAFGVPEFVPMAQARLGILLMGAGETERAQQLLEDTLASGAPEDSAIVGAFLAHLLAENEDWTGAESACQAVIETTDPTWTPVAQIELALIRWHNGDTDQARELLQSANASSPDVAAAAYGVLGDLFATLEDTVNSHAAYEAAIATGDPEASQIATERLDQLRAAEGADDDHDAISIRQDPMAASTRARRTWFDQGWRL